MRFVSIVKEPYIHNYWCQISRFKTDHWTIALTANDKYYIIIPLLTIEIIEQHTLVTKSECLTIDLTKKR